MEYIRNMSNYNKIQFTDLQNQLVKLLIQKKLHKKLIIVNFLNVAIGLISSWLLFQISIGDIKLIYPYVFLDIFHTMIDSTYILDTNTEIANIIRYEFKINAITQYKNLSFDSKNKALAETFYQKMIQASDSFYQLISWGIPNIFKLIGSFIQCLIIFYFKRLSIPFGLILVINLIAYYKYIKNKQKEFSDCIKTTRESNDKIRSLVSISLPMFQYNEKSPEYITNLTNTIDQSWYTVDNKMNHIMTITRIINKFGIIIISLGFNESVSGFLLLVNTFGSLNGSISSLTAFMSQNNRYETNYDSYIKFFKNLNYQEEPEKFVLPQTITIKSININHGGFNMSFGSNISSLQISIGHKILIRGRTGHGKSTFINALMGKIKGIEFDLATPENYFHSYVEMYQNIREKLPTSSISIRKIFDDDQNDDLIIRCLKPCFPDDDLDRIFSNLIKSHNDKEMLDKKIDEDYDIEKGICTSTEHSNLIDNLNYPNDPNDPNDPNYPKKPNPLDVDIAERISGGEKTRLALATRIYQMITKPDKHILILDEPEQGSDPEVAVKVIGNIIRMFHDRTIIMISHICECQLNALGIVWDHKLSISRGKIDLL
jgi:ABC-type multidrug transport system fused ATPase/permease subunit